MGHRKGLIGRGFMTQQLSVCSEHMSGKTLSVAPKNILLKLLLPCVLSSSCPGTSSSFYRFVFYQRSINYFCHFEILRRMCCSIIKMPRMSRLYRIINIFLSQMFSFRSYAETCPYAPSPLRLVPPKFKNRRGGFGTF